MSKHLVKVFSTTIVGLFCPQQQIVCCQRIAHMFWQQNDVMWYKLRTTITRIIIAFEPIEYLGRVVHPWPAILQTGSWTSRPKCNREAEYEYQQQNPVQAFRRGHGFVNDGVATGWVQRSKREYSAWRMQSSLLTNCSHFSRVSVRMYKNTYKSICEVWARSGPFTSSLRGLVMSPDMHSI